MPDGGSYVPEPAWTRNGAGRWFDNWYGFGLVDAGAAVAMAKVYTTYLTGPMKHPTVAVYGSGCGAGSDYTSSCGDSVPTGTTRGLDIPISIGGSGVGTIEALQLTLGLGQANMGDMAVEVVSPAGTRSVLLNAFNVLTNSNADVNNAVLASNAFNGESAQGVWHVRLIDVAQRPDPQPARLQGAALTVMGH